MLTRSSFTAREIQVIEALLAGADGAKTIARQLGVSNQTIKVYIGTAGAKVGCRRSLQLCLIALGLGFENTYAASRGFGVKPSSWMPADERPQPSRR